MEFKKNVIYLGCKSMFLKDGTELNTLTFFDTDGQDSVQVNVMASNTAVMNTVYTLAFGASCTATFVLRDADKRTYRLALSGLAPAKA